MHHPANSLANNGLEDDITCILRTLSGTNHIRPCKLASPTSTTSTDPFANFIGHNLADRSVAQPGHCKPFLDLPAIALELYWPYPCTVRITADHKGDVTIGGDDHTPYTRTANAIKQFAPRHYGINTNAQLAMPRGWGLLVLPHPRAYCDPYNPANTTPYILPGIIESDWWPSLFFVVGVSPPVGRSFFLTTGEPYAILVPLRTRVHTTIVPATDEQASTHAQHQKFIYDNYSTLSTMNWRDDNGKAFGNVYKQLSARFRRDSGIMDWLTIEEELVAKKAQLSAATTAPNPAQTKEATPVTTAPTLTVSPELAAQQPDTVNSAPQPVEPDAATANIDFKLILTSILEANPDFGLSKLAARLMATAICDKLPAMSTVPLTNDSITFIQGNPAIPNSMDTATKIASSLAEAIRGSGLRIVFAVVPTGIEISHINTEGLRALGLFHIPPPAEPSDAQDQPPAEPHDDMPQAPNYAVDRVM